jgi:hypothetical protein
LVTYAQDAVGVPEEPAIQASVIFRSDVTPMVGAFKMAEFGHTSLPIFKSQDGTTATSTKVCIKRCFYHATDGGPGHPPSRIPYDSATQAKKLAVEMYCATWGAALMQLVYDFMAKRVAIYGVPPFSIPQMRYVRVALAVANNATHDSYVLEEVIDEACDGVFLKYINNDHNAPIERPDHPERKEIGEFLAFAQHVQYLKTQKMVFVSDIQGLYSRLV